MPLNPQIVKKRSEPVRMARIDCLYRVPLPSEMGWNVGTRVYFSLARSASVCDQPPGIVVTNKPKTLWQGRLISGRIRRAGFAPLAKACKKPPRSRS